jgi:hypothetical protein
MSGIKGDDDEQPASNRAEVNDVLAICLLCHKVVTVKEAKGCAYRVI